MDWSAVLLQLCGSTFLILLKDPGPGLVPEVFSSLVIQGLLVRETDVEFRLILLKY